MDLYRDIRNRTIRLINRDPTLNDKDELYRREVIKKFLGGN
jgi:hypothetical protein